LAAACATRDDGGAVLLVDLETGQLRSVFEYPESVGWPGRDLLHWHPSGDRLVTNISTNAIGVVEPSGFVARALPDDGRDHGVRSLWAGDVLFADTGDLFDVKPLDDWLPGQPTGAPWMSEMTWSESLGAVVGRTDDAIVAFDPAAKEVVHRKVVGEPGNSSSFSPDGAWFVEQKTFSPEPIEIAVFEVRPPWRAWMVEPNGATLRAAPSWGPNGRLALYTTDYERDYDRRKELGTPYVRPRFEFVKRGEIVRKVALETPLEADMVFYEVPHIQWSPGGGQVAMLAQGERVQVFEWSSGRMVKDFRAPAPLPPSDGKPHSYLAHGGRPGALLWATPDRFVRLDHHFIHIWNADGEEVGELTVSM
jgi:hypothetical protein